LGGPWIEDACRQGKDVNGRRDANVSGPRSSFKVASRKNELIKPELSAAKYFVTLKNNDEQI
jgi:hypothetical protein